MIARKSASCRLFASIASLTPLHQGPEHQHRLDALHSRAWQTPALPKVLLTLQAIWRRRSLARGGQAMKTALKIRASSMSTIMTSSSMMQITSALCFCFFSARSSWCTPSSTFMTVCSML